MSLLSDIGTAIKNKLGGTSVDNTVPRYDGTTCKLQGSGVTISDTNTITASGGFVGNLTGNASTSTKLNNSVADWSGSGAIGSVVGMLAWKNFGNGHVIFDASNSTSPSGSAVNNTNAQVAWSSSYPTIMGWNGSQTYGVRVDSARIADSFSTISGSAPSYACRAWVNFNGTGTVAIRGGGNVSSITDNGVGLYTINLITALPDTNFAVLGNCKMGDSYPNSNAVAPYVGGTHTTSAISIYTAFSNGSGQNLTDFSDVYISFFR